MLAFDGSGWGEYLFSSGVEGLGGLEEVDGGVEGGAGWGAVALVGCALLEVAEAVGFVERGESLGVSHFISKIINSPLD